LELPENGALALGFIPGTRRKINNTDCLETTNNGRLFFFNFSKVLPHWENSENKEYSRDVVRIRMTEDSSKKVV